MWSKRLCISGILHIQLPRMNESPMYGAEISLASSEDVGMGVILGGVNNHIKAFMLHPPKDQRGLFIEGP